MKSGRTQRLSSLRVAPTDLGSVQREGNKNSFTDKSCRSPVIALDSFAFCIEYERSFL